LGGQIYVMAGMRTRLNLLADAPGQFVGRNTQYSGRGFSQQHFTAIAMTRPGFEEWVAKVKESANTLDTAAYERLARPGTLRAAIRFSSYKPNLFDEIIVKYSAHMIETKAGKAMRGH
jgi:cytochrome o ubiquinol oxidase subunit 2